MLKLSSLPRKLLALLSLHPGGPPPAQCPRSVLGCISPNKPEACTAVESPRDPVPDTWPPSWWLLCPGTPVLSGRPRRQILHGLSQHQLEHGGQAHPELCKGTVQGPEAQAAFSCFSCVPGLGGVRTSPWVTPPRPTAPGGTQQLVLGLPQPQQHLGEGRWPPEQAPAGTSGKGSSFRTLPASAHCPLWSSRLYLPRPFHLENKQTNHHSPTVSHQGPLPCTCSDHRGTRTL